jgi:hypothetical protein
MVGVVVVVGVVGTIIAGAVFAAVGAITGAVGVIDAGVDDAGPVLAGVVT